MTNAIIESIVSRSTTKYYDPAVTLNDDQIRELVRIGTTAPTSFHLQNWRFIDHKKSRLSRPRSHFRPSADPWGEGTRARMHDFVTPKAMARTLRRVLKES